MSEQKDKTGVKYDSGKPPIWRGVLDSFPRAIEGVAASSDHGADKYTWDGWCTVDNAINRYTDAMLRHLLAQAKGEVVDSSSGLPHHYHVSWNALAVSELRSRLSELESE